jgi:hypothetical protein
MKMIRSYGSEMGYVVTTTEATIELSQPQKHGASFLITRISVESGGSIPEYSLTVKGIGEYESPAYLSIRCMSDAVHFCAGTLRDAISIRARRVG